MHSQPLGVVYRLVFAAVLATGFASSNAGATTEKTPPPYAGCGPMLFAEGEELDGSELLIDLESHRLEDLLVADPARNLAVLHPHIVMDAVNRSRAWLNYKKPYLIDLPPFFLRKVKVFPVLSDGVKEVGGRRVIEQYEQLEQLGDWLDAGADGDGSAAKTFQLTGPAGTAKTEALMILNKLQPHLQIHNPDFYNYTFEWHDLMSIPELRPIVISYNLDENGNPKEDTIEFVIRSPLEESPFSLLPEELQDRVLALATPRAKELFGRAPRPWRGLNFQDDYLRKTILTHYARKAGKAKLSLAEAVAALSKHVTIKRRVIGGNGRTPKINAQGKDVDYQGLFMAPNAFVINQFGTGHPFAYFINGRIAAMHGGMICMDEYWRNDVALRDALLELQENKVIERGGAPPVPLDLVILSASNTESIEKAKKQGEAKAQIDRTSVVEMPYSRNPFAIAKTYLLKKNPERLEGFAIDPSAPGPAPTDRVVGPLRLDDLYPIARRASDMVGPDNRFKLWIRVGDERVHFAPHVLEYMAMITAATRMSVDASAAAKHGAFKVINTHAFRDQITRLKVIIGKQKLNPGELQELEQLAEHLNEGHFGLTLRDGADNWLTDAINEARKPGNGHCVTPLLVRDVLARLLRKGKVQAPDNETELKWLQLANRIAYNLLVPQLEEDVVRAIGEGEGRAEAIYDELYLEFEAVQDAVQSGPNPPPVQYRDNDGEIRFVDWVRLQEIQEHYQAIQGRPLAIDQIVQYHARPATDPRSVRRHDGLMSAIQRWLARNATRSLGIQDLSKALSGTGGVGSGEFLDRVQHNLVHKLGYCPKCMRAALELRAQMEALKAQQPRSN